MSELRQQLTEGRNRHAAAIYPGDLAAELLPARPALRPKRLHPSSGFIATLAALLALIVWLRPPQPPEGHDPSRPAAALAVSHPREHHALPPSPIAAREKSPYLAIGPLASGEPLLGIPGLPALPALPDISSLLPAYRDFRLPAVPDLLPTSLPDPIPSLLRSIPTWGGGPREAPPSTRQAA